MKQPSGKIKLVASERQESIGLFDEVIVVQVQAATKKCKHQAEPGYCHFAECHPLYGHK